ncbi:DNA-binding protein [Serratia quinivorans]|uniref:DNA-binding protein n=1 Tax=Serratia quinivorans TaxID=137545 RepID=UPI0034C684FA
MKYRDHYSSVIELIRKDQAFALAYLNTALEELDDDGGEEAFLIALNHIVEANGGVAVIADKARISRGTLYRALSPKGNPKLKTIARIIHASGMKFTSVTEVDDLMLLHG